MLYPIILSGGTGTRLWPLSRAALPKQLLPLTSERSMIQETLLRLQGLDPVAPPVVICNQEHRFLVAEQLREIDIQPRAVILEPEGRNTAPAVAVAAIYLLRQDPDALMLVLPADHIIMDIPAFHTAVERAAAIARQGQLVTFGIVPDKPETGYGYIRRGVALASDDDAYGVACFVEKPDFATACQYVASGQYYWNSGMYVLTAQQCIKELEHYQPELMAACGEAVATAYEDLDFLRLGQKQFLAAPAISFDHGVMEKTANAAVVPLDVGWSDIGSWSAAWELHPKDADGNAASGEVLLEDTHNCYVSAQQRLVATLGVRDLVIVETSDAVLVARRDCAQDVKKLVERLRAEGRTEHEAHRKVYRPWGSYEGMDRGERFQVKRITVNAGAKLSLQMHHHRAEHWIVVSGTAEVTIANEVRLVTENESIYIPIGIAHRLHNPGRIPLHLIEVQSGPYLNEDDIVRLEDNYGREIVG